MPTQTCSRLSPVALLVAPCSAAAMVTCLALFHGCGGEASAPPDAGVEAPPVEPPASSEDPVPPDDSPPKRIFVRRFVANVRDAPRSDAPRIGYLRGGAVLTAKTSRPVATDERCRRGFYELSTGGYVCSGRDVTAFDGRRLPEARATQPDRDALLPYRYGYARHDNTPVYRQLPDDEQAAEFEGYQIPGAPGASDEEPEGEGAGVRPSSVPDTDHEVSDEEPEGEGAGRSAAPGTAGPPAREPPEAAMPAGLGGGGAVEGAVEDPTGGGGAPGDAASAAGPAEGPASPGPRGQGAGAQEPGAVASAHAEDPEQEAPPTLEGLQGERDSVLLRWMMKGFYVSLDRDFRVRRRRYWRTQQHELIPYDALGLKEGGDFAGAVLGAGEALPIGYVLSRRTVSYHRREGRRPRRGTAPGYHHRFAILGEEEIHAVAYYAAADDLLYRVRDITRVGPRPRPEGVGEDEKWIDVDLSTQVLVAYEGDRPVFATLVSTGIIIRPDVPELDHATPTGRFRIRAKHLATTMDGDNAFDGPYSIQDVPYVMYYEQGYALHAAFWHNQFGRTKSHGCVNLSPRDARWIFRWSDPQLPAGWHGVYPDAEHPGTVVVIHGETPLHRR